MNKLRLPIFIFVVCMIAGCGVAERTIRQPVAQNHPKKTKHESHEPEIIPPSETSPRFPGFKSSSLPLPAYAVSKYKEVQVSLEQAYRDWKGTPYVWGGETHAGVDCSGLMQLLFSQYFGVKLPRTTRRQLYAGKFIHRDDLKSGDLVFFDTGRNELHVGVVIRGNKFLNASVSQGVTISSLKNPYWKSHYMTARRVMKF